MREHLGEARGTLWHVDGGATAGHGLRTAHGNVLAGTTLGTPTATGSITLARATRTTIFARGPGRRFGRQGGNGFPCRTLFFEVTRGV